MLSVGPPPIEKEREQVLEMEVPGCNMHSLIYIHTKLFNIYKTRRCKNVEHQHHL